MDEDACLPTGEGLVSVLFHGFGIQGYRSFYEQMQFVGPLQKINLLAGQNNSGKSNIIRYLKANLASHMSWTPQGLDQPRGLNSEAPYAYAFCLPPADTIVKKFPKATPTQLADLARLLKSTSMRLAPGTDRAWVRFIPAASGASDPNSQLDPQQLDNLARGFDADGLAMLARLISGAPGGMPIDNCRHIVSKLVEMLEAAFPLPDVRFIDAFRQVGGAGDSNRTGHDLVRQITVLQSPTAMEQPTAEAKYEAINKFVSTVLGQPGIKIEVPHDRSTVNVRLPGRSPMPLDHQGTGIHQVIILATEATVLDNTLVCIEEPEINLHPIFQRRLLDYLSDNTTNQYIIATHSAQMLDYERANVFHLEHTATGTVLTPATTPAQMARICFDLGYHPSDLLQSNSVIWVEGPSDRIYVNHWISEAGGSSLKEGVHYSIMYYGGSLLRDLCVDDELVSEFVKLRRLNRHLAVIIDSDRTSEAASISATKQRIVDQFAKSDESGFAWVTDGYTIENYVPVDVLKVAMTSAHPRTEFSYDGDPWANPLGALKSIDKVKVANEVVAMWNNCLSDPNLRSHIERLIAFIRQANGTLVPDAT